MATETETEPDYYSLIFGEPALLKGECREAYTLLRTCVAIELKASDDVFSQLKVQEVTDAVWEGRRFKRLGTQMVESALVPALQYLLQPACAGITRSAEHLAQDYYFGKPENQKLAKEVAAGLGITPEGILGQAFAMSGEFRLFDRLVDGRAATLRGLLKDHERQLRRKRKAAAERQRQLVRSNDNSAAPKKDPLAATTKDAA
jgi:hypothetical protein